MTSNREYHKRSKSAPPLPRALSDFAIPTASTAIENDELKQLPRFVGAPSSNPIPSSTKRASAGTPPTSRGNSTPNSTIQQSFSSSTKKGPTGSSLASVPFTRQLNASNATTASTTSGSTASSLSAMSPDSHASANITESKIEDPLQQATERAKAILKGGVYKEFLTFLPTVADGIKFDTPPEEKEAEEPAKKESPPKDGAKSKTRQKVTKPLKPWALVPAIPSGFILDYPGSMPQAATRMLKSVNSHGYSTRHFAHYNSTKDYCTKKILGEKDSTTKPQIKLEGSTIFAPVCYEHYTFTHQEHLKFNIDFSKDDHKLKGQDLNDKILEYIALDVENIIIFVGDSENPFVTEEVRQEESIAIRNAWKTEFSKHIPKSTPKTCVLLLEVNHLQPNFDIDSLKDKLDEKQFALLVDLRKRYQMAETTLPAIWHSNEASLDTDNEQDAGRYIKTHAKKTDPTQASESNTHHAKADRRSSQPSSSFTATIMPNTSTAAQPTGRKSPESEQPSPDTSSDEDDTPAAFDKSDLAIRKLLRLRRNLKKLTMKGDNEAQNDMHELTEVIAATAEAASSSQSPPFAAAIAVPASLGSQPAASSFSSRSLSITGASSTVGLFSSSTAGATAQMNKKKPIPTATDAATGRGDIPPPKQPSVKIGGKK